MILLFEAFNELFAIKVDEQKNLLGSGKTSAGVFVPLKSLAIDDKTREMYSLVEEFIKNKQSDKEVKSYLVNECSKAGLSFIRCVSEDDYIKIMGLK